MTLAQHSISFKLVKLQLFLYFFKSPNLEYFTNEIFGKIYNACLLHPDLELQKNMQDNL